MGRYKEPYTLYKRGKYWYYRTYDARGIRTSGISTGKTSKTAARDFCEALHLKGTLSATRQTYKEYAEYFFVPSSVYVKERPTLTESSRRIYNAVNNTIITHLGSYSLIDITTTRIKELRVTLMDYYSIRYINTLMVVLSIVMTQAVEDELISRNPCAIISALSQDKKGKEACTVDQVIQIYSVVPEKYKPGIILLALTGCRVSEMLGIRPQDVIQEQGVYFIKLTKQIDSRGLYGPLKTKKERYIPIIPELIPLLYTDDTTILYPSWRRTYKRAVQDANIDGVTTHTLRHFFITQAKADGISPLVVETIAGHSLKGIEGIYTNFKPQHLTSILNWQKKYFDIF